MPKRATFLMRKKPPSQWGEVTAMDLTKLLNSGKRLEDIMKRYRVSRQQFLYKLTRG